MKFRPVPASSGAGGGGGTVTASASTASSQFSIPTLLPSSSTAMYEELIRGGGGGGGVGTGPATRTAAKRMGYSPPPPPSLSSSAKKILGSGGGGGGGKGGNKKRSMVRSPLSFLSPNEKSVRSAAGSGGRFSRGGSAGSIDSGSRSGTSMSMSMGGGTSVGSSARKLFVSPTRRQYSPAATRGGRTTTATATTTDLIPRGRGSMSGSKVKGSLRKERKRRRKSSTSAAATATAATEIETATEAGIGMPVDGTVGGNSIEAAKEGRNDADAAAAAKDDGAAPPPGKIIEFTYQSSAADAVRIPGPAVLKYFHGLVTAGFTAASTNNSAGVVSPDGAASASASAGTAVGTEKLDLELQAASIPHQVQLDSLGTELLSLEDVLIPALAHEENAALKRIQAKMQRDPDANAAGIQTVKAVRAYVVELAGGMAVQVKAGRLRREEGLIAEERRKEEEMEAARAERQRERRAERERAREERREERKFERERAKLRRRKAWPKNKELWREVAVLMTDLARLQGEEKMWDEAGRELEKEEEEVEGRIRAMQEERRRGEDGIVKGGAAADGTTSDAAVEEGRAEAERAAASVRNAVDDVALSAGRIEATLSSIVDLMARSDEVRKELYGRYRSDHQFYGYRGGTGDARGLIVALSQDC